MRDLDTSSDEVIISGDEANHAGRSRRLRVGDNVCLTDGRGARVEGRVSAFTKPPLTLTISVDQVSQDPAPTRSVTLASALPKGDRLYTLLDMATQLGIQAFQPLDCVRSVVRWQPRMKDRCTRVMESAAKQCRQTRIPEILNPVNIDEIVASTDHETCLVLGSATGRSLCDEGQCIIPPSIKRVVILVGPEGGFDPGENGRLSACAYSRPIRCGNQILRTETAAIALLAVATQWIATAGDSETDN